MKRMLFTIILLAICITILADEDVEYIFDKYSWHPVVFLGGGFASSPADASDLVIGFNLGAAIDIEHKNLKNGPILQLGLRYRTAGYSVEKKINIATENISVASNATSEMYAHYADVFSKFIGSFPFTPSLTVRPYFGFALGSIITGTCENSSDTTISGSVPDSRTEKSKSSFGLSEGWNMGTNTFLLGVDFLIKDFYYVGVEYDIGIGHPPIYLVYPATIERNGVETEGNIVVPRLNNLMLNVGVRF